MDEMFNYDDKKVMIEDAIIMTASIIAGTCTYGAIVSLLPNKFIGKVAAIGISSAAQVGTSYVIIDSIHCIKLLYRILKNRH